MQQATEAGDAKCCERPSTCERGCIARGQWIERLISFERARHDILPPGYNLERTDDAFRLIHQGIGFSIIRSNKADKPIVDFLDALLSRIEEREEKGRILREDRERRAAEALLQKLTPHTAVDDVKERLAVDSFTIARSLVETEETTNVEEHEQRRGPDSPAPEVPAKDA